MFSFFKKKSNLVTDIHWLGVDIHNHLLPGIDDGCKNFNESLAYIRKLEELGFKKLICTPHIFKELYPNNPDTIFSKLKETKSAVTKEGVGIEIAAAAEYMIDDNFHINDSLMTLPGNYLLIEMSYLNETPNIEQVIFDLQIKGYNIILAHPERYNFYHKNHSRYRRLKDMGCLFQLNLLSVTGYYGREVRQVSEYLLQNQTYDLAGTDLHHENHLNALMSSVTSGRLYNSIGQYTFKNKELFG